MSVISSADFSFKTSVEAPRELLWKHLVEKVKHPNIYVPGVKKVELQEVIPNKEYLRVMSPGPEGITISERIIVDETSHFIAFIWNDHSQFTGSVINQILAEDEKGNPQLVYAMHWYATNAESQKIIEKMSDKTIRGAVLHMKEFVEKEYKQNS